MKKSLIILVAAITACLIFVGCSPAAKTYTVKFDANGGTGDVPSQTTGTDGKTTKPKTIPTHVGWGLLGWSTEKDGDVIDFDKYTFSSDTTLYAKWKTSYNVGDEGPAGGIIFYDVDADNSNTTNDGLTSENCNWRYLEAGASDVVGGRNTCSWGLTSEKVNGTKTGIGDGKDNTDLVSDKGGAYAAANEALGDNYNNGYDDWFLPSKDELNQMYTNLVQKNKGSFGTDYYYWSSSESSDGSQVWMQYMQDGTQREGDKDAAGYVRPCRMF